VNPRANDPEGEPPSRRDADSDPEFYGEYPANISHLPGAIKVDAVAHRLLLAQEARKYLTKFPDLRVQAERLGKDLVAFTSSHGNEIIIGIGVASTLTGGVILYRHRLGTRRRRRRK
jgi:hypothetical protein